MTHRRLPSPQRHSGQVAVVLSREKHPRFPNHVVITAKAVTECSAHESRFSRSFHFSLLPGEFVTFEVAHDVTFRETSRPSHVDGAHLAYYAMRGLPVITA